MPAKSGKQLRWAFAAARGDIQGVEPSVGEEMVAATPDKKKKKLLKKTLFEALREVVRGRA